MQIGRVNIFEIVVVENSFISVRTFQKSLAFRKGKSNKTVNQIDRGLGARERKKNEHKRHRKATSS